MILIIICLAAVLGLIALVLKLIHYKSIKIDLQRAEANLAASNPGGEFDSGAEVGTLVAEIIQDLASQMPVTAALASAEKRDDASFASAAASCIISLLLVAGLAGTLWAFSGALGNRPNIDKKGGGIDADAVIKYTDQVHTGLTGAFWPSFAGITCTVLLFAFRALFVHPNRDLLFADLERFGHHLTHKLFPPNAGDKATMLHVVSKLETISTALESNSKNLSSAASSVKKAAEKLDLAVTGIATANLGFERTFGSEGVAAKGLAGLRETFTQFAKSVKEERKQRKESEDGWLDALTKIASQASSQEAFAQKLDKITTEVIDVQAAQTIERDHTLKSINTLIETLRTASQAIESKWEVSHRDALVKFGEAITSAIQKVADSASGVPETIAHAKLSLDNELLNVQRSLAEAHTVFLRRIEEAVKKTSECTEHAAQEMTSLERGMSRSLERLTHNVNSLVGTIDSLTPHLRTLQVGNFAPNQSPSSQRRSLFQKMFGWIRRSRHND